MKVKLAKNRKRMMKSAVNFFERYKIVGLRISGHRAAGIFIDLTEEHESLDGDQFDECD